MGEDWLDDYNPQRDWWEGQAEEEADRYRALYAANEQIELESLIKSLERTNCRICGENLECCECNRELTLWITE